MERRLRHSLRPAGTAAGCCEMPLPVSSQSAQQCGPHAASTLGGRQLLAALLLIKVGRLLLALDVVNIALLHLLELLDDQLRRLVKEVALQARGGGGPGWRGLRRTKGQALGVSVWLAREQLAPMARPGCAPLSSRPQAWL